MYKLVYYQNSSGRAPVAEFIDSLSRQDIATVHEKLELIVLYGYNSGLIKPFKGVRKLFEARIRLTNVTLRLFVCFRKEKVIILLHGFIKKTKQTPTREIQTAEKRLKEVLENE